MDQLPPADLGLSEPTVVATCAPRLSILHLMLWTFCSAVYLAWSQFVMAMQQICPQVTFPCVV